LHADNPLPELQFTRQLLEQKPNNYSAWHNRSSLLDPSEQNLEEEFDFVQNEFYTDPKDQSPWIYHRWLFSHENVSNALYEKDMKACQDLLEIEPDSKWATLTVIWLHKLKEKNLLSEENEQQAYQLLEKLKATDPYRVHYYDDVKSDIMLHQQYIKQQDKDTTSLSVTGANITRFDACKSFTSLVSLDLSNNAITSLYFLSATVGKPLAQLQSLNLANNNITFVEQIHLLPALKKLNLSGNAVTRFDMEKQDQLEELDLTKNRAQFEHSEQELKAIYPALTTLSL